MGEFFNGWRRKTGFVFLLFAGLVTLALFRSQSKGDIVTFPLGKCGHKIDTGNGHFLWLCRWFTNGGDISSLYSFQRYEYNIDQPYVQVGDSFLEKLGFYFSIDRSAGIQEVVIPYWSLIVPFCVASAWLIGYQPREKRLVDPDKSTA